MGESHVDWDRLQSVAEGFAKFNGGEELSVDDYRVLIQVQIQKDFSAFTMKLRTFLQQQCQYSILKDKIIK